MSEPGFRFCDDLGPKTILHCYEPSFGLKAILVVDNVAAGPAIGGVRMAPDVSLEECFRLARAMTFKNAAAGLPHGGGKSVLYGDPATSRERKQELVRAMACALGDCRDYIFGPDMGTDEGCMACVKAEIGRAVGLPREVGGIPLDEIGETPAEHAEIRERDGLADQLLVRDRTGGDVLLHGVHAAAQVGSIAVADVAHDRREKPVLGFHGDAEIDPLVDTAGHGLGIEPGVQRRRFLAARGHGANQPRRHVCPVRPGIDIRLVGHRGGHNLPTGAGHVVEHRPAHAADRLRPGALAGRAFHVGLGHRAAGPRRLDRRQIDAELCCKPPDSRRRLGLFGRRGFLARRLDLTDDRALVRGGFRGELDQCRADGNHVARRAMQRRNAARMGRRHLDHRLVGLDRDQRLVGDHMIADADVPGDDLRLLQSLSQIRQFKDLSHGKPYAYSSTRRAAATMRSGDGM